MDFFGIGGGELILIIIIGLIIMGPGKVVQLSRDLGKTIRAFKKAGSELTQQIQKEVSLEELQKNHTVNRSSETTTVVDKSKPIN